MLDSQHAEHLVVNSQRYAEIASAVVDSVGMNAELTQLIPDGAGHEQRHSGSDDIFDDAVHALVGFQCDALTMANGKWEGQGLRVGSIQRYVEEGRIHELGDLI